MLPVYERVVPGQHFLLTALFAFCEAINEIRRRRKNEGWSNDQINFPQNWQCLEVSGREDLNLRPLAPHASALAGLRHAPI